MQSDMGEGRVVYLLREGEAGHAAPERIMDPEHFEFRGESSVPRAYQVSRTIIGG